jgi:hypothetical protein
LFEDLATASVSPLAAGFWLVEGVELDGEDALAASVTSPFALF